MLGPPIRARGETAREMMTVLRFPSKGNDLHAALGGLLNDLEKTGRKKGCRLNIANRLWGQDGYGFMVDFLKLTEKHYGADLAQVDFGRAQGAQEGMRELTSAHEPGQGRRPADGPEC